MRRMKDFLWKYFKQQKPLLVLILYLLYTLIFLFLFPSCSFLCLLHYSSFPLTLVNDDLWVFFFLFEKMQISIKCSKKDIFLIFNHIFINKQQICNTIFMISLRQIIYKIHINNKRQNPATNFRKMFIYNYNRL